MNRLTLALGVVAIGHLGSGGSAWARSEPIVYTSQERFIEAWGIEFNPYPFPSSVHEKIVAKDFGPFEADLYLGQIVGAAKQTSVLEPYRIVAQGHAEGNHYQNGAGAVGTSDLLVKFTLTQPMPFRVHGFVDKFYSMGGETEVSLTGPGTAYKFMAGFPLNKVVFDEEGTLPAGNYTLIGHLRGHGAGGMSPHGEVAFALVLDFACPADCDASGALSIDDFLCFQTNFVLGDPLADCDASGALTIDDFICFQTQFVLGC